MKRLPNGNIEITLTIRWSEIQTSYEKIVIKSLAETEVAGFRKGKAPRNIVEPKLDKTKIYTQALQDVLPRKYSEAVKEHSLKPILYPQIKVTKGEENKDWEVVFTTCEAPVDGLVPELLVEEETNHRLAHLVENLTKLGMTTDQYLASKKLTVEDLKANTLKEARTELAQHFLKSVV